MRALLATVTASPCVAGRRRAAGAQARRSTLAPSLGAPARSWRIASTRDSQHGPPCKGSTACFLDNLDTIDEPDDATATTSGVFPRRRSVGGLLCAAVVLCCLVCPAVADGVPEVHPRGFGYGGEPGYAIGHTSGNNGGGLNGGGRKQPRTRGKAPQLPLRNWSDMTTEDFRQMAEEGSETIAILPVSAIEQHGPHLPMSVDADLNLGVLARALELADPAVPLSVLPMQKVGKSNEHIAFPGTLSLSTETLTSLWLDIGDSVARAGVKKLVLFNSHGGQPQVMEIVARELRIRHGMLVVCLSWFGLGLPDGLISRHEQLHGIHGGEIETSMMLHLRPELVHMDQAEDFVPLSVDLHREFKYLLPEGGVGFGWQSQDLHPSGATGNAAAATAEKGKVLVDHAAEKLVDLLEEVQRFPLSYIRPKEEAGGDAWRAGAQGEGAAQEKVEAE